MLEAKGLEAGAREEARWDGRDFDALGNADRSRYLCRFADGVTAYLEAVGGGPTQAPAVRVKMKRCATEGCDNPASVYFERGGVGSHYCSGCGMKIEIRSALEAETGGGDDWTVDDSLTAREILAYLGIGSDASLEPFADRRRDHIAKLIQKRVSTVATPTDERAVEALLKVQEFAQKQCDATLSDGSIGTGFRRAMLDVVAFCDGAALAGSGDGWRPAKQWPEPGDEMEFLASNGYPAELEHAMTIFTKGQILTVESCEVGGFDHRITFKGVKGRWNGVMFALRPASPSTAGER